MGNTLHRCHSSTQPRTLYRDIRASIGALGTHARDGIVGVDILMVAFSSAHAGLVETALIARCRDNLRYSSIGAGGEHAPRDSPQCLYVVWRSSPDAAGRRRRPVDHS